MTLSTFSKKLRQAADILDDLLGVDRPTGKETPATAAKILNSLKKQPYHRKGLHWTQRPENKARLKKILKRAQKQRMRLRRRA